MHASRKITSCAIVRLWYVCDLLSSLHDLLYGTLAAVLPSSWFFGPDGNFGSSFRNIAAARKTISPSGQLRFRCVVVDSYADEDDSVLSSRI